MNALEEQIIRAVAAGEVTRGTRQVAQRLVADLDRRAALSAAKACTTAKVAKQAVASVEHHAKARRQEERDEEKVKRATWDACLERARIDHRGRLACEACAHERPLEPHHLVLRERTDAPDLVMALCGACHRTGQHAAHRRPAWFAKNVVVPWAEAHGYAVPNRKEYRT